MAATAATNSRGFGRFASPRQSLSAKTMAPADDLPDSVSTVREVFLTVQAGSGLSLGKEYLYIGLGLWRYQLTFKLEETHKKKHQPLKQSTSPHHGTTRARLSLRFA